jgi:hypothetical protein
MGHMISIMDRIKSQKKTKYDELLMLKNFNNVWGKKKIAQSNG